jgi:hypothetical protein
MQGDDERRGPRRLGGRRHVQRSVADSAETERMDAGADARLSHDAVSARLEPAGACLPRRHR